MKRNNVVLVDENDNAIAEMEKLIAHDPLMVVQNHNLFINKPFRCKNLKGLFVMCTFKIRFVSQPFQS